MKLPLLLAACFAVCSFAAAADPARIAPAEAAKLVAAGKAVLVDCREPAEWAESGVAAPAVLLPKSNFDGDRKAWTEFLAKNKGKQVILYCRSGNRSGTVAAALAQEGVATANAGSFKDWSGAGLPTRKVEAKK